MILPQNITSPRTLANSGKRSMNFSNMQSYQKNVLKTLGPIIIRNSFNLITLIIGVVVALLLWFREYREGFFLATVIFLNIIIGIIQELRAKIALEKLQALIAQKVIRINADGKEEIIGIEEIKENDQLKLKLGDQVPADGFVMNTQGFEVNESLLTGESDNISKEKNDKLFAGSIVVAGFAMMKVELTPDKSYVTSMTRKIKHYSLSQSPIQHAVTKFIEYMSYVLLIIVGFVIIRGIFVKENIVEIIKDIAALTGTLVPEGLILATTVLFAYGAIRMFHQKVLLQEINATERLGRIENLCIDKTGTLTENQPTVDEVIIYNNKDHEEIATLTTAYIKGSGDGSETGKAITNFLEKTPGAASPGAAGAGHAFLAGTEPASLAVGKATSLVDFKVLHTLPFSSQRKYGIVTIEYDGSAKSIVLGAPDILLESIENQEEKQWLKKLIDIHAPQAKRLVLVAESDDTSAKPTLKGNVRILALYILSNPLRPGTADIISFFQERGVNIRVISGDNPKTVQAIAKTAGISKIDKIYTGSDIETWEDEDYKKNIKDCHLFSRIKPEQKEKLVESFKEYGFTAMVGDGANDALAIKKADLGIAMFDGASATRQIAQVVLVNNSFSALPAGVRLADSIISTIEMVACVFFNKVASGLPFFIIISILGYSYPISPRNMTVINYLTIGLPILFWAIYPANKKRGLHETNLLSKILPLAICNGFLSALAAIVIFTLSPAELKTASSNVPVVLMLVSLGFWFFINVPMALGITKTAKEKRLIIIFGIVGITALLIIFNIPFLADFFGVYKPSPIDMVKTFTVIIITGGLQYYVMKNGWWKKLKFWKHPVIA